MKVQFWRVIPPCVFDLGGMKFVLGGESLSSDVFLRAVFPLLLLLLPPHPSSGGRKGIEGRGGGDESRVSRGERRRRLSKKIPETGTTFAAGDVGGGGRRGGSGLWKLEGGEIAGEILSLPILLLPLSSRMSLDREEEENIVQEGSFRICFCSRVRTLVKHKVRQQDFLYSSYRSKGKCVYRP